ncbi:MAG: type II toxin-antitoxin system PemK/MazF family toxin [Atopobiaceae bacterium]|nr:type II toxin-antitoxin system PemK/MazF family toxin [Atopobiaceae bacterium]
MSVLEQGDVIEVVFNPGIGHEPAKRRPALVVTSYAFNVRSSLVGVVPIQSKDTGYPLHVPVDEAGLHGYACVEQVRNIDVERSWYRLIGYASDSLMRQVAGIIRGVYGLR